MQSTSFVSQSWCRSFSTENVTPRMNEEIKDSLLVARSGYVQKRSRQLRFACGNTATSLHPPFPKRCNPVRYVHCSFSTSSEHRGTECRPYGVERARWNQGKPDLTHTNASNDMSASTSMRPSQEAPHSSVDVFEEGGSLEEYAPLSSSAPNALPEQDGPEPIQDESGWTVREGENKTLFLVDAFGLLFRSYYALAKTTMSSRSLFDTRAVYGFTTVMLSFLQKHARGNPVAVVFEGRKEQGQVDFRTSLYPQYKENRGPTPTGVVEAVPWVKRMCQVMGLAVVEVDVYEADDTIGSIVRKAKQAGIPSVIVSIDKDFRQLLDGKAVRMLRPGSGGSFEYVTEELFRSEFGGVHPRQYVDILTLIGDKVDGLKGVPGIGKLTAPKLVAQYGSLETLLSTVEMYFEGEINANAGPSSQARGRRTSVTAFPLLTKRTAASLRENGQHALLVKQLITIKENVPLSGLTWENLQRAKVDEHEAMQLLDALEFTNRNIVGRVLQSADDVVELAEVKSVRRCPEHTMKRPGATLTTTVSTLPVGTEVGGAKETTLTTCTEQKLILHPTDDEIEALLKGVKDRISVVPLVAGPEPDDQMVGIAIAIPNGPGLFVDLMGRESMPVSVQTVLQDTQIEKRGWFMKMFYKKMFTLWETRVEGILFDIRIAAEALHAGERITDSRLAAIYLGNSAMDPFITGNDHRIPLPETKEECLGLCHLALQLSDRLLPCIRDAGLEYILYSVELPLIPVLAHMEITGVPIDSAGLQSLEGRVRGQIAVIESRLREIVPVCEELKTFRPSSRDDVSKLLFDVWKIKMKGKKTPKGRFSVNKAVLSSLAQDEKVSKETKLFAQLMLEHREATKILTTYTKSLLSAAHSDGRIRATFIQEAAATGRLSTSKPNLQSIPIRSELGREVRSMVKAPAGFSILCADYSQIELRIIASMSGDEALQLGFKKGLDIHRAVAAKVFNVSSPAEVSEEQRRKAKEVNFGIPYGISSYGLGQHLNISTREASDLMSQFHEQFPRVRRFTAKLIKNARETGFAKTMLGRRLALPLISHGGPAERKAAERIAINMPIQGTQADMIKLAMIRIAERLRTAKAKSLMIMQIHDELLFQVDNSELEAVIALVKEEMASALPLSGVEIVVNTGVGDSWLSAAQK